MFFVPNNVGAINFGLCKKIDIQCVVISVAIWAAIWVAESTYFLDMGLCLLNC